MITKKEAKAALEFMLARIEKYDDETVFAGRKICYVNKNTRITIKTDGQDKGPVLEI